MSKAIGIDLGTSYSCVSVWDNENIVIIPNEYGKHTTPSCVAFTETEIHVGDNIKNQNAIHPINKVFDAKRLIGRQFDDPKIAEDMLHWPFLIVDEGGKPKYQIEQNCELKKFSPEEISAMILIKMKEIAEAYLCTEVVDAVITVPAYFNNSQRQATKEAGELAGLNVIRILNETTAAALAYRLNINIKGEKKIMILDLGGGTYDVSILTIDGSHMFEVKSTNGDTHMGGQDFDNKFVNYLIEKFNKKYHKDLRSDVRSLTKLKDAAERAKRVLSIKTEAVIKIDDLIDGIDYYSKITRGRFEDICSDLFKMILEPVEKALDDAGFNKNCIDDVVLIGGSTRMPIIQSIIQNYFSEININTSINPFESVAYGAALQAAILSKCACIEDFLLVDITPLSLGIETAGKLMTNVIERNTKIPCKEIKTFTTYADNQSTVKVNIFEGENEMTQDNNYLGSFELIGIPPQIEIIFNLDNNGILNVSTLDSATGNINNITIIKAKIDSEDNKENKTRNQLELYALNVKQSIENAGDKLTEADKTKVTAEFDKCIAWLYGNSLVQTEDYIKKPDELAESITKLHSSGCNKQADRLGHLETNLEID